MSLIAHSQADPYETDDAGVVVDVGTDDDVSPFYEPKTSLRAISQEEAALDAERAVSDAATSAEAVLHAVEEAATGRKVRCHLIQHPQLAILKDFALNSTESPWM